MKGDSMRVRALRSLAAALLIAGVCAGAPSLAGAAAVPAVPAGRSVYDAPVPLPPGKHGDLIWATEIRTEIPNARAWKILYRSTDVHDVAMPVSGMVVAPKATAPANGRPVVTFAHGTTGIARNCALSMVEDPAKDASIYFFPDSRDDIDAGIPGLTKMIRAGYAVAATDYNGLGAPGVHQYLIGPTEGRNVLDAAVAAQQIPEAGAGKRTVILGWSQGGQASVWAAQLSDYVAGSAEILGAASLAPVNALEQKRIEEGMVAQGKQLPQMMDAETIMAQYASAMTFPELKLSDVLTPFGVEFITTAAKHQCNKHMGSSLSYMQAWKGPASLVHPKNEAAWMKRTEQMALGNVPLKVPVAVYQGDDDALIFPAATEAYVKKACAGGATIAYAHYAKTDHLRVLINAQDDYLKWIADRFAGKPASSSCK